MSGFLHYDKAKNKFVCPFCEREFAGTYKGVKAGHNTTKGWISDMAGLARANFEKHLKSHQ